jgi:alkylation response protein AidB-like acyl-CoA dehydrogenase
LDTNRNVWKIATGDRVNCMILAEPNAGPDTASVVAAVVKKGISF